MEIEQFGLKSKEEDTNLPLKPLSFFFLIQRVATLHLCITDSLKVRHNL